MNTLNWVFFVTAWTGLFACVMSITRRTGRLGGSYNSFAGLEENWSSIEAIWMLIVAFLAIPLTIIVGRTAGACCTTTE
jgi:hypothetical protein